MFTVTSTVTIQNFEAVSGHFNITGISSSNTKWVTKLYIVNVCFLLVSLVILKHLVESKHHTCKFFEDHVF